ncbi:hypothetical protein LP420_06955 [Massilia sp. B-10]|nr:hypothetical protein LP420_06955 [Massilia sp. B-10]
MARCAFGAVCARLARHSTELEAPLLARLKTMRKQQLFVVVAGPQTTIDALREATPDPGVGRRSDGPGRRGAAQNRPARVPNGQKSRLLRPGQDRLQATERTTASTTTAVARPRSARCHEPQGEPMNKFFMRCAHC